MKFETEIRDLLISNAINLIAEGGFEKATTKELAHYGGDLPGCKMNESYIYRLFESKEHLYEAAFVCLDSELCDAFLTALGHVRQLEADQKEKFRTIFLLAWEFVLRNEARFRCYIRYYYSVYFRGDSLLAHQKLFSGIVNELSPLFKSEADVTAILHTVLTTILAFAVRVYNGELPNDDDSKEHIFNVLYCILYTYLA